jgi:ribosomal protein S18 acetylase RimI-like enzyme
VNSPATAELEVVAVREVSEELAGALTRLVPQLSSSAPPPGRAKLAGIAGADATTLFVARLAGEVVGMLTHVTFEIPTGLNALIEDVVVDEAARGSGVGAGLVSAAIEEAARRGARHVDLTSRPSRDAANRLYQKMGFKRRETNVYRHDLG